MNAVYKAINAVQAELAKTGISKDRTNNSPGGNYKFRSIDDVYAALAPLLSKHGLCVVPRMSERTCEERRSASNKPLFFVTLRAEFDFVSAEDGSIHTAATYGEAMDSSDKATNKAMSAAYKYAAFLTFCIPTEGDNDADAVTHELAPTISEEQRRELADLIDLTGTDIAKLCANYKVDSIKAMNVEQWMHATKLLRARLEKRVAA